MMQIPFEMPALFCAGEPSGDLYAGYFIEQLRERYPEAHIWGVGGYFMLENGAEPVSHYRQLMTFGLSDSFASLFRNLSFYREIGRQLYLLNPSTFVAVAYPGVNLMLCRVAKRMGMRVYYLLPPQIWAWGTLRKYFIRKWVDAVISVFPFEARFYRKLHMKTFLMDNPLACEMQGYRRTDFRRRIGFMPGSRRSQIRRNVPVILELASLIRKQYKEIDLCALAYDRQQAENLSAELVDIPVVHENRYGIMKNCDLLVVCSGTASLEAAFLGVPQIFFHRPSFFDFYLLRRFMRTNEYNLTNIYYGQKVVPSFIDYRRGKLVGVVYEEIRSRLE
jgi:lipid-A-disaccharide synthase